MAAIRFKSAYKGSKFSRQVGVELHGLDALLKRLKVLPTRIQRRVLKSAVTKAATPVLKAAKRLAPAGTGLTPDGRERVSLKKSLVKTRAKLSRRTGSVYIVIGPKAGQAPHSHLVHDGTQPHEITLTKPLTLQNVTLPAGFVIQHLGAKAQPFLADAVDATQAQSTQILQRSIATGIEKEARKLGAVV